MLIETHAHLDYPDFASDLDDVLCRAADAGVTRIITIGTSIENSRQARFQRAIERPPKRAGRRHPLAEAIARTRNRGVIDGPKFRSVRMVVHEPFFAMHLIAQNLVVQDDDHH